VTGPLRRGGVLVDEAGRTSTWSVAEGSRGRRWRWTIVDERGSLVATHVLELDPAGAFSRLESAGAAGLLTLHREADGSVHGHRVGERGVDHLNIPAPAPEVVLVGSGAVGLAAIGGALPGDGPAPLEVIEVSDDLGVETADVRIRRLPGGRIEIRTSRANRSASLGDDGLPVGAARSTSWPLERD